MSVESARCSRCVNPGNSLSLGSERRITVRTLLLAGGVHVVVFSRRRFLGIQTARYRLHHALIARIAGTPLLTWPNPALKIPSRHTQADGAVRHTS